LKTRKLQLLVTCQPLINSDWPSGIITITVSKTDEKLTNHADETSQSQVIFCSA